jgi:hypothetical protein
MTLDGDERLNGLGESFSGPRVVDPSWPSGAKCVLQSSLGMAIYARLKIEPGLCVSLA